MKVSNIAKLEDWEKTISMFKETAVAINHKMEVSGNGGTVAIAGALVISCFVEADAMINIESLGPDRFKYATKALDPIKDLSAAGSIPEEIYSSVSRVSESYIRDWKTLRHERHDPFYKTEKDMRIAVLDNWENSPLSQYNFVRSEMKIEDGDRIDIFAKTTKGLPVLIELKKFKKDGYKQLRSYATNFNIPPILINISERNVKNKKKGIKYFTMAELHGQSSVIDNCLRIEHK